VEADNDPEIWDLPRCKTQVIPVRWVRKWMESSSHEMLWEEC
jgi:hypothetical protein